MHSVLANQIADILTPSDNYQYKTGKCIDDMCATEKQGQFSYGIF